MVRMVPDNNELSLLRDMFYDAASMYGEECSITLYNSYSSDDFDGTLGDPITYNVGVFFEEYPQVRLLKSLNWYSEDEEILPSILYIPKVINGSEIEIREGSRVDVKIDGGNFNKSYKISSVKVPYNNVIFYICKLVPWFDNDVRNIDDVNFDNTTYDDKYNFFDVER